MKRARAGKWTKTVVTKYLSLLTCPRCGFQEALKMPGDACVVVHDCDGCGARLKPGAGDCCVFCSWGDTPCPPVQIAGKCCGGVVDDPSV